MCRRLRGTLIDRKTMKYKFSINSAVRLGIIAIACVGLSGTALAQGGLTFDSKPYPTPDRSGKGSPAQGTAKSKPNTAGRKLSSADKAFIQDAAKGGMMEVAMGRVAEQNATDSEVKNFGGRMVKDHGKANDELKTLAKEENVQLPAEKQPGKWKSDKDYMGQMVKDHEKDLAAFEKEAKEGSDPDVKSFASKTSEVVRKHLEMAKKIDSKLK
jgi:putative membrane protein